MRAVVVVEPENPENTGFIARLCGNFDFKLRIVNPDFNLEEARKTASRAQEKLRHARIFDSVEDAVEGLKYVVGTKPGKGAEVSQLEPHSNTSIMVGPESSGLTNEQLDLCDSVSYIDTSEYSSINQSHAAAILMYELREKDSEGMTGKQKQKIQELLDSTDLEDAIIRSNPSRDEAGRIIGEIKDLIEE